MRKAKPDKAAEPNALVGSVFHPIRIKEGDFAEFVYDESGYGRNSFRLRLRADGTLEVQMAGSHSDLIATHHHVANSCILVPRRWSNEHNRHVELIREEKE